MRVLRSTMIGLALGAATLTSVGAGVAAAAPIAPAQSPTWSYVAPYKNRGACDAAIAAYLTRNPAAGTDAERAHHARESNDLPGAFGASLAAAAAANSSSARG